MNTLRRLKPFRHMAAAAFALLVAGVFLVAKDSSPAATPPRPPASTQQAEFRPPPRIAPAKHIYKVETNDPVVFLTIDDGQYRTANMADILKRNGIKATFFLTEAYVRHDPDFFRRLRDDTGSVIENHTATHTNLKGRPAADQAAEIGPVSDHYAEWFGTRPTLFRAPYGNIDDNTLQVAGEAGCQYVVNWGSEVINGKIHFSGPTEFRPGSIVLTHFRPTFEADVNAFIAQARQNGLTPALLTDYLK